MNHIVNARQVPRMPSLNLVILLCILVLKRNGASIALRQLGKRLSFNSDNSVDTVKKFIYCWPDVEACLFD